MSALTSQLVALPKLLVSKHFSPFAFPLNTQPCYHPCFLFPPSHSLLYFSKHENRAGAIKESQPWLITPDWTTSAALITEETIKEKKVAGSFILVGRAQGRSERGVFDRPFTLPVLIIPAFPLSGLNTTTASGLRACLALPPTGL